MDCSSDALRTVVEYVIYESKFTPTEGPANKMMLILKSVGQTVGVILAAMLLLVACVSNTVVPTSSDPLIDQVVRSSDGRTLSQDNLLRLMADAQVIYLGERHDNERHHQLQLEIVRELLERGRQPALAFEFFSVEQSGYLLQYTHKSDPAKSHYRQPLQEDGLRQLLGWKQRSDSEWERYAPLLRLAQQQAMPVYGIDLPKAVRSRMVQHGVSGLTAVERGLLYPTGFENQAYQALMQQQLAASHCGLASEDYLARLYETWVARNDAMAVAIHNIVSEHPAQPVVVLMGAGHARHNMGVYERVEHLQPDIKQINLGLREVMQSATGLEDYIQGVESGGVSFKPDHEYLWFTPSVDSPDPCEQYHEQLKTLKRGAKNGHGK